MTSLVKRMYESLLADIQREQYSIKYAKREVEHHQARLAELLATRELMEAQLIEEAKAAEAWRKLEEEARKDAEGARKKYEGLRNTKRNTGK